MGLQRHLTAALEGAVAGQIEQQPAQVEGGGEVPVGLLGEGGLFGVVRLAFGGVGQGPDGYEGHVTFYVEVPNVEEALQKAESLGGKRIMGPEDIMGQVVLGQFTDPEGHMVGVVEGM